MEETLKQLFVSRVNLNENKIKRHMGISPELPIAGKRNSRDISRYTGGC